MVSYRRPSVRLLIALALPSALALASCATRISVAPSIDPAAGLPRESSVYFRLDRAILRETAEAVLSPESLKAARPFLLRTERLTVSVLLPQEGTEQAGDGSGGELPRGADFFGIAEGSYPAGAASFRLRLSRDWRKEGTTLVRRDGTLRIAFAGKNLLVAGTSDLGPLLEGLASPGPNPLPEEIRRDWEAPGALWVPRPGDVWERARGEGPLSVPARGLLLTLIPYETGGGYSGSWIFVFDSEREARIYSPICRLFHLAFIRAALGSGTEAASALDRTVWSAEGSRLRASGFPVSVPMVLKAASAFVPQAAQSSYH